MQSLLHRAGGGAGVEEDLPGAILLLLPDGDVLTAGLVGLLVGIGAGSDIVARGVAHLAGLEQDGRFGIPREGEGRIGEVSGDVGADGLQSRVRFVAEKRCLFRHEFHPAFELASLHGGEEVAIGLEQFGVRLGLW